MQSDMSLIVITHKSHSRLPDPQEVWISSHFSIILSSSRDQQVLFHGLLSSATRTSFSNTDDAGATGTNGVPRTGTLSAASSSTPSKSLGAVIDNQSSSTITTAPKGCCRYFDCYAMLTIDSTYHASNPQRILKWSLRGRKDRHWRRCGPWWLRYPRTWDWVVDGLAGRYESSAAYRHTLEDQVHDWQGSHHLDSSTVHEAPVGKETNEKNVTVHPSTREPRWTVVSELSEMSAKRS